MKLGSTRIDAGALNFAMEYRDLMHDQGVCLQVGTEIDGKEVEILRFDCFDHDPHYHYGPEKNNERLHLDTTTAGNPIGWTLNQLRNHLPQMIRRAGYDGLADKLHDYRQASLVANKLNEVEETAREMSMAQRAIVIHNRGDEVYQVGNMKFGLEFRELKADRGLAIHVLSDVAGQEIEILAFDCFENHPHYHYGTRNKNIRLYWDRTTIPDTLEWTMAQFKGGKLPAMIQRAGYPSVVAEMDNDLIVSTVAKEIAPRAMEIRAAHTR
jgi:hypothetical protein